LYTPAESFLELGFLAQAATIPKTAQVTMLGGVMRRVRCRKNKKMEKGGNRKWKTEPLGEHRENLKHSRVNRETNRKKRECTHKHWRFVI
jgi:hypothetical protein